MMRSIHTVLLVLALATAAAMAGATASTTDELIANAPGPGARDGEAVETPASPWSVEPLCPGASATGFDAGAPLPWAAEPQVGSPCCASLCEQVCGVGEPCACKRCQVLGCGL